MERISKQNYYLAIAKEVASRSTCLKRKYGCVLVKNDEIIATGYNGSPRGEANCCDIHEVCPRINVPHNQGDYTDCPAVHAEQNAIISAARSDMIDSIMYLYGLKNENNMWMLADIIEPCPICERMIKNAGIKEVVTPYGSIGWIR